jgi:hypothetical protein
MPARPPAGQHRSARGARRSEIVGVNGGPPNTVVGGNPARVLCSMDEFVDRSVKRSKLRVFPKPDALRRAAPPDYHSLPTGRSNLFSDPF